MFLNGREELSNQSFLFYFLHAATVGGRGVCVAQTCTDARSAHKTAHIGTTRPTPRSKRLRRCAFSDLCRSSAVNLPPGGGIGVRVLPASRVLVPKRYACARRRGLRCFATTFYAAHQKVISHPLRRSSFPKCKQFLGLHFGFLFSRYISRYENLKFGFLPFVVVTIVAMVFSSAVFAARAPAMGNSADRAWQLSQPVTGVFTAFNPSAWQPVLCAGRTLCVQADWAA